MPKQRTGYIYFDKKRKTWTARLTYKDELGRTRNFKRQAKQGIETPLKLATINRELQLLRAVLNFARRKGWLVRNPFELAPHADRGALWVDCGQKNSRGWRPWLLNSAC